jgi:hypothetical protein
VLATSISKISTLRSIPHPALLPSFAVVLCLMVAHISVVPLAFAKPDCTYTQGSLSFTGTGLLFSTPGVVKRDAIAGLKATRREIHILLFLGGSEYTNWAALNITCLCKHPSTSTCHHTFEPFHAMP